MYRKNLIITLFASCSVYKIMTFDASTKGRNV